MRTIEVAVDEETARSLSVEARHLDFEGVEEYVRWVIERRFAIDGEDRRCRRLESLADRAGEAGADAGATALAATVREEEGLTIDGDVERVARLEDDELAAAADTLSTVETQRIDEFARRAVEHTRARLGDGVDTGIAYDPATDLSDDAVPERHVAPVEDVEVPGRDEDLVERRRVAVGAAVAFLREVEEAKRSEFVEALYDQYPAGYDSPDAWWECVKEGLRQVDRVDPAGESKRTWGYRTTPGRVTRISF